MPPRNKPILNMIASIGAQEGLRPENIQAMQATSMVESGLRPGAIGDGGTSYGLFQHHVGGAGGSTHEQARRFLDPATSIRERARWYRDRDIRAGRGAAALQRPADPAGYAVKVDAALRSLGSSVSSAGGSTGGQRSRTARSPQSPTPLTWGQQYLVDYLGSTGSDPVAGQLYQSFLFGPSSSAAPKVPDRAYTDGGSEAGALSGGRVGTLRNYKDLVNLAKQHGLNIQGDFQTTGGRHSSGSDHYSGLAVDFGDATNSPDLMKRFASYLSRNSGSLGIKSLLYDPMNWYVSGGKRVEGQYGGHQDHLHVGLTGG